MNIRDAKNRLLSEIKVNNPNPTFEIWEKLKLSIYDIMDNSWSEELDTEYFSMINKITNGFGLDWNKLSNPKRAELINNTKKLLDKYKIDEDVNDFSIGKTTQTSQGKTIVTDIDPETQSVTWSVNKNLTDEDIHRDLSKLINKLESNKKNYSNEKRLKELLQKLKFIRNTFKRSM